MNQNILTKSTKDEAEVCSNTTCEEARDFMNSLKLNELTFTRRTLCPIYDERSHYTFYAK